jgi:AraC-like DNA-binding protein
MEICAFILMAPLPIAGVAVGCLLIIIALVAVVLYLLRAREVATLKKEVSDLRDTIRMMRYEEANLARMLHTASKPAPQSEVAVSEPAPEGAEEKEDAIASVVEESVAERKVMQEKLAAEPMAEETFVVEGEQIVEVGEGFVKESVEELAEEKVAQEESEEEISFEEISPIEGKGLQETEKLEKTEESSGEAPVAEIGEHAVGLPVVEVQISEVVVEEALETIADEDGEFEESTESIEASVADIEIEEESEVEKQMPVAAPAQKQPINERRPAIPTDLFSAWFAENEEDSVNESAEVEACQVVEPSVPVEADVVVESESSVEQPVKEAVPLEILVPEANVEPVVQEQFVPEQIVEESSSEDDDALSISAEEPTSEPLGVVLSKEDERFCRKLERIVSTRLRNPNLNVDTIAAQFGIGRTNFYRKVRELTGISPNDYLRKYRMERAAELLRTTELPVSEVCVQVGIPDAQYFSKVFKVYFELTPTAYREKNQTNQ